MALHGQAQGLVNMNVDSNNTIFICSIRIWCKRAVVNRQIDDAVSYVYDSKFTQSKLFAHKSFSGNK